MSETIIPISNPDGEFKTWALADIYDGVSTGRYIPNIDDLVFSPELGFFIVTAVDANTGLSTLTKWTNPESTDNDIPTDTFIGSAVGTVNESFRIFVDTTVLPHTLACDSRLHIYGTTATNIKVFKGTDISNNGIVVSAMYDGSQNYLGENIPLELVKFSDGEVNVGIKTPVVGYTTFDIASGELLTVVVYDDLGHVLSYSPLVAIQTSFARTTEAGKKYVTGIHLESSMLDPYSERTLLFPTNMAVSEVPALGVVSYSDGSTMTAPINTSGFKLLGLEQFVSTVVGQKLPLVLSYTLADNEYSYGLASGVDRVITVPYFAKSTPYEKSFAIKMFIYPEWVDNVVGFKLNFYLSVLGGTLINVTDLVKPTTISEEFNGLKYAIPQRLSYAIEMSEVSPVYSLYRFIQPVTISLLAPGNTTGVSWLVEMSPNQTPPYGVGLLAKVQDVGGTTTIDLSSGFNSLTEWLDNVYFNSEPLFNTDLTTEPETPNVMLVEYGDERNEMLLTEWNQPRVLASPLVNGQNVRIKFIYRSVIGDNVLGISEMPIVVYPTI